MTLDNASKLEASLTENAYILGSTFKGDKERGMDFMNSSLRKEKKTATFKCITIDTAANRRSFMSQY